MKLRELNGFVHIFALDVNCVQVFVFSKDLERLTQIVSNHRIHFSRVRIYLGDCYGLHFFHYMNEATRVGVDCVGFFGKFGFLKCYEMKNYYSQMIQA